MKTIGGIMILQIVTLRLQDIDFFTHLRSDTWGLGDPVSGSQCGKLSRAHASMGEFPEHMGYWVQLCSVDWACRASRRELWSQSHSDWRPESSGKKTQQWIQYFLFIENRLFSYDTVLPPGLLPPLLLSSLLSRSTPVSLLKRANLLETTAKHDKVRYNVAYKSPHSEVEQGNPIGGQRVRDTPTPCWEFHKNTKLASITHAQRTWCRPRQALCFLL